MTAPAPADLVHQTSASTSTGNFTLAAVNGRRSFNDAFGTGGSNLFVYYISSRDAGEWERGTGHLSDATTLVRDTVIASSNANAAVSFSAGTKDVMNDVPASERLQKSNALSELTATAATARANVYAAPFDALAFNGMQVNGSMEVSQEKGTTAQTAVANGTYIVDGVKALKAGTMVMTAQQVADAPPGFQYSAKLSVTTAEASIGSGDYAGFQIPIEGYRVSRLAFGGASAQALSFGFWIKAHRTGTYSGAVYNSAVDRSYPFSFTVNASDTWEFKTVTLLGDTSGTWLTTSGTGLLIDILMAVGTTYAGTANAWTGSLILGVTGSVNGVAATSDTLQICGVIVLPGIELPSSTRLPLIMRPFDQELWLAKRQLETSYPYGTAIGANSLSGLLSVPSNTVANGQLYPNVRYAVEKRAAPTVTCYGYGGTTNVASNASTGVDLAAGSGTPYQGDAAQFNAYNNSGGSVTTASNLVILNWKADARL